MPLHWPIDFFELLLIVVDLALILDHLEKTDSRSPYVQRDDVLLTQPALILIIQEQFPL